MEVGEEVVCSMRRILIYFGAGGGIGVLKGEVSGREEDL